MHAYLLTCILFDCGILWVQYVVKVGLLSICIMSNTKLLVIYSHGYLSSFTSSGGSKYHSSFDLRPLTIVELSVVRHSVTSPLSVLTIYYVALLSALPIEDTFFYQQYHDSHWTRLPTLKLRMNDSCYVIIGCYLPSKSVLYFVQCDLLSLETLKPKEALLVY